MATWNSANASYQTGNKTLFEVQMLATPDGTEVSNVNPLPVTLGNANVNINANTINVSVPNTVVVNSSPTDPVHVHLSEVGNSGILTVPYMPVGGNVSITGNVAGITSNVTVSVNNFPTNQTVSGNVNSIIYNSNGAAITTTNPLPVTAVSANSTTSASFEWQVAFGNIPNATQVNVFGYSDTIANTYCISWENSPLDYVYLNTAQSLSVNSTSTSDNSNAKILITGLDSNWAPLSEVVTLNGTAVVTTTNAFLRVNSMAMTQPGTGQNTNLGTITAYYGTTQLAKIAAQIGRSQMSQYSVANGYTLYVQNINMFSGDAAGASKFMNFRVDVYNAVTGVNYLVLHTTWQNQYQLPRSNPFAYSGKNDIRWQMATNSGTYTGSAVIEATLIKNN